MQSCQGVSNPRLTTLSDVNGHSHHQVINYCWSTSTSKITVYSNTCTGFGGLCKPCGQIETVLKKRLERSERKKVCTEDIPNKAPLKMVRFQIHVY
jgi:hypothetical protein